MDTGYTESLARLDELFSFMNALHVDVNKAMEEAIGDGNTPYKRRTFVRAMFGEVEGVISAIKQSCLHSPFSCYSNAELAMLREETYSVNDRGQASVGQAKIRLGANLQFAFEMFMRPTTLPAQINKGGGGWEAFRAALRVRDRLMHPKKISDLDISDQELQQAGRGRMWFLKTLHENMKRVHEDYQSKIANIEKLKQHLRSRETELKEQEQLKERVADDGSLDHECDIERE